MKRILFILLFIPVLLNGQFLKGDGSFVKGTNGGYFKSGAGADDLVFYVSSIEVAGEEFATTVDSSETLQMEADVLPSYATNKNVTWSVTNGTGTATITQAGVLTGGNTGTVTVKATAQDGTGIFGTLGITVTVTPLPPSTTGEGIRLWSQDFDDESTNASVSTSEMLVIIGEPATVYNFDNDGDQQIEDGGSGDMYFSGVWDIGGGGGSYGWHFEKTLRGDEDADFNLNDLTEIWQSFNVRFPDGFTTAASGYDGKMPGGLRGSYAFEHDYDPTEGYETYTDGFLVRKYFDDSSPINHHKHLTYWKDMTQDYGTKSGVYYPDYPTNSEPYSKLSTSWQNVAIRLKLNTDASTYDGILEVYIDERLAIRETGKRYRVSDTVFIDWALWGFFPNSSDVSTVAWQCDIDDLHLFTFTEGDSTFTGNEQMTTPYTVDVPGWPKGEDLTDWGQFEQPTTVEVTSITVAGAGSQTTIETGETLQMLATVLPSNATNKAVTWSRTNQTGTATITTGGLVTGGTVGTVLVTATAQDGSGVVDNLQITIEAASGWTDATVSDLWDYADSAFVLTFENSPLGPYYKASKVTDFTQNANGSPSAAPWGYDAGLADATSVGNFCSASIVDLPEVTNGGPTRALQVEYEAYKAGLNGIPSGYPPEDPGSGIKILTNLYQDWTEAYFSYCIMWKPGTSFELHGKIPTIKGHPSPDHMEMDWSAMAVFDGDNDGGIEGGMECYVYYADDRTSGDGGAWIDPATSVEFQFDVTGWKWYHFTVRVYLNDVGYENGGFDYFINGVCMKSFRNRRIRELSDAVNIISLQTFYGGNSAIFQTHKAEFAYFDAFHVWFPKVGYNNYGSHEPANLGDVLDETPGWDPITNTKVRRASDH